MLRDTVRRVVLTPTLPYSAMCHNGAGLSSRTTGSFTMAGNRIIGMFGQHVSPAVVERLGGAPDGAPPYGAIQVKGREQPVEV